MDDSVEFHLPSVSFLLSSWLGVNVSTSGFLTKKLVYKVDIRRSQIIYDGKLDAILGEVSTSDISSSKAC